MEHEKEVSDVKKELNQKINDLITNEESLNHAWKLQREEMENEIENLKGEIEKSREEYKSLNAALDNGEHEYIRYFTNFLFLLNILFNKLVKFL